MEKEKISNEFDLKIFLPICDAHFMKQCDVSALIMKFKISRK